MAAWSCSIRTALVFRRVLFFCFVAAVTVVEMVESLSKGIENMDKAVIVCCVRVASALIHFRQLRIA